MDDLAYLVVFLACCGLTGGLAVLCDGLMPRASRPPEGGQP